MTDHATEQVALFMNARDHRDYGTAIWSELDIVGREAYLTDAAALVAAVKALGWAPALTPTDDEVEALARLVDPGAFVAYDPQICDPSWPAEVEHWQTEARHHADRILAAGFRRTVQGEPSDAGVGWFEWFKMPENTTEIAYVHESGEVFDPVRGWNPVEFTIASAEGRVFRLVRAGGVR